MATPLRREMRFTRKNPCPICGGGNDLPPGRGVRCYGFLSADGRWAHCTREEYSGGLPQNPNSDTFAHKLEGKCACGLSHDGGLATVIPLNGNGKPRQRKKPKREKGEGPPSRIVATYDYTDEEGRLLFQTVRKEPKTFFYRRPDGQGGWIYDLEDVRLVPYRLPDLLAAEPEEIVWIAEGEKDVDRLWKIGCVATTNPFGAKKWRRQYNGSLRGKKAVVLVDNDDDGREHANRAAYLLQGDAASIKTLALPGLPEHGDVSDWLDAGGSVTELLELAEAAPEWTKPDGWEPPEDTPPFGDGGGEENDGRPWIDATQEDLPVITAESWDALAAANDPPRLFTYADSLVRIELNGHRVGDGTPILRQLDTYLARYELAQSARFFIEKRRGQDDDVTRKIVLPPMHVVHNVLATPDPPLPKLTRIVQTPVFAPNGELQEAPGYHPASRTFYAPDQHLVIPPLPEKPSPDDIDRARSLITDDLIVDFPFVEDADRAAAIALFLLPFVRDLIDGPTPLHLIEAPAPGSGKGLLADVLLRPSTGSDIGVMTDARDDDEWRKRITTVLGEGKVAILIDNVKRPLDSANLAAALTALLWQDRRLGQNDLVQFPIRCAWVATANNPTVSTELARRCIRIRLDPRIDYAWQREGFKHGDLRTWTDEHRGELVWAALVLTRAWLQAGRPRPNLRPLGSYERWSYVIGGVLEHAGIAGFLANLPKFYEEADFEGAAWRQLVAIWWEKYRENPVGTSDLFPLALQTDMGLGKGNERSQQTAFGMRLKAQRDRVIGDFRIVAAGTTHKVRQWRLLPTHDMFIPEASKPGDLGDLGGPFHTPPHAHARALHDRDHVTGSGGVEKGPLGPPRSPGLEASDSTPTEPREEAF